jgi:RNA polymerase sigma factor (sigma-70 family)
MSHKKSSFLQMLYQQHCHELRQFLIRRVGEQEAADLLQETWLKFLQIDNPDTVRMPRAFLYRTASNVAIDYGRKLKHSTTFTDGEVQEQELPSSAPGQDIIADGQWQYDRYHAALQELPEISRQAFMLSKVDGLTHTDIAKRLGISQKTVQRLVIHAFQHCIKRLAR